MATRKKHTPEQVVRKLTEADRLLAQGADNAAVIHLIRVFKVSQRRACTVIGQHRSTQRHTPPSQTSEDPDAGLRDWLRDYAGKHPRWGFRRAHTDLRKEG